MKKLQLEYNFKSSPSVLFSRLSTASGLSEWFADNVTVRGKTYTFVWDSTEQEAEMIGSRQNDMVRFRWTDCGEDCYFEFKVARDELTGDVSLVITDFVEEDEIDDAKDLWNSQIAELKHALGS
ncbi:hypothetical protein PbJCM13498_10590 [Prolixibacter bellariivorans]|uniref:START-like domain-containing protein n=1 Tax=Prolixibacter bellariivorans TaxID=314319 RepID=A0A5M4AX53_9BACT|nr:START-like domain-containing protein [Prolixibacter bellariivorans]GET32196.1 hypothetical protein PbJCM13498_10590 [Prolixibacter bellariivorans]